MSPHCHWEPVLQHSYSHRSSPGAAEIKDGAEHSNPRVMQPPECWGRAG